MLVLLLTDDKHIEDVVSNLRENSFELNHEEQSKS